MINVSIICDNQIFSDLLKQHLSFFGDIRVTGMLSLDEIRQADTHQGPACAVANKPDIILFSSPCDYTEVRKELLHVRKCFPDSRIIFLFSMQEPEDMELNVIKLGARGFLSSKAPLKTLIKAIKSSYTGEIWASRQFTSKMIDDLEDRKSLGGTHLLVQEKAGPLTKQETRVLMLIASGFKNAEIAEKLFISEKTVKTHINRIFNKIKVKNRLQAALWASKHLASEGP